MPSKPAPLTNLRRAPQRCAAPGVICAHATVPAAPPTTRPATAALTLNLERYRSAYLASVHKPDYRVWTRTDDTHGAETPFRHFGRSRTTIQRPHARR